MKRTRYWERTPEEMNNGEYGEPRRLQKSPDVGQQKTSCRLCFIRSCSPSETQLENDEEKMSAQKRMDVEIVLRDAVFEEGSLDSSSNYGGVFPIRNQLQYDAFGVLMKLRLTT